MQIGSREVRFSLVLHWYVCEFWGKYPTFLLLKVWYLLEKLIFFAKLFLKTYYFLTLHIILKLEKFIALRKHENSKKQVFVWVLELFVEGHCTSSVNLHFSSLHQKLMMSSRSSACVSRMEIPYRSATEISKRNWVEMILAKTDS